MAYQIGKSEFLQMVRILKQVYPKGTRVMLKKMHDVQAPPVGTLGTVTGVDDVDTIMVDWDNGSHLGVVLGVDMCLKIGEVDMKKRIEINNLVDIIKGYYPEGTRVELVLSTNKFAPSFGTKGTVQFVDDIGNILVAWDNGVYMTAVLGEDVCRKVKENDNVKKS